MVFVGATPQLYARYVHTVAAAAATGSEANATLVPRGITLTCWHVPNWCGAYVVVGSRLRFPFLSRRCRMEKFSHNSPNTLIAIDVLTLHDKPQLSDKPFDHNHTRTKWIMS